MMSIFKWTMVILIATIWMACEDSQSTNSEERDELLNSRPDVGGESISNAESDLGVDIVSDSSIDSTSNTSIEDLSVALFEPDHLIEVVIELDRADWDALRDEGRSLTGVFSGCERDYDYTYFHARVEVDGEVYEDVAVRKKGFLGSLSNIRPSLKLNFGKFVKDQTHADMKRMTLNNNKQDPSNTHQCMAYQLFALAGVIAPRCNFAHVVVNGEDLGIYSHIESVKKPMLARHFEDNSGNLYEGQGADFIESRVELMELKTNETENDRSDLDRVTAALTASDDQLLSELGEVVDIDAFLTFWAMEVLLGHWDSYSGNRNNYLTYHDPTSDLFYFIPWGTDGSFTKDTFFNPGNNAVSIFAHGQIANRLYNIPQGRAMYLERLNEVFDAVWDEDAILAEVSRIGELTNAPEASLDIQRDYIVAHGIAMQQELAMTPPEWINRGNFDEEITCREEVLTPTSGTFSTTWGSIDNPTPSSSTLNLSLNGQPFTPTLLLGAAGLDERNTSTAHIRLISPISNEKVLILILAIPASVFEVGEIAMHGFEINGMLITVNPTTPNSFQVIGFIGDGTITLDTASMETGGAIEGRFEGNMLQIVPF